MREEKRRAVITSNIKPPTDRSASDVDVDKTELDNDAGCQKQDD